ncbi:TetR/AcrR family transcriptional regulator [Glycomyces xiaoerkulensis]|uniref:TetR/AcrR family transcriptional regulator n=1 Tax=Glycomyces xiaoerkulensis TaxID=2038139 RepID=UPI000C263E29|nr:TetR/AcrR family transcriptional regulator [Glycomyces xiaoerkulensis]
MARTLDPVAHARRRDAFLDAAERLLQSKGYEDMSVADVLKELDTSKGAFYHYFDSKQDLAAAVMDRTSERLAAALAPVVDHQTGLAPLDKLQQFLAAAGQWKTHRRELLLELVGVWYSDANAVVRQRLRRAITSRIAPLLAELIDQGIQARVFTATDPESSAVVLLDLALDLNDRLAEALLTGAEAGHAARTTAAYTDALERVLGVPSGSVVLIDPTVLAAWFPDRAESNGDHR